MGTPLQDIYDSFESNIDENLTGKEELIFTIFKKALSKCYKYVIHSLTYTLTDKIAYEGNFDEILDEDEITLLGLEMLYEHKRRRKEKLESQQDYIGTKDFKNFPNKVEELRQLNISMKDLMEEIKELRQEFNSYKYEG